MVETVLRFRDAKDRLTRRGVVALLPRLAAFSAERFATDYLTKTLALLLAVLKVPEERGAAFAAIGELATAMAKVDSQQGFEGCLPPIAAKLRETLLARPPAAGAGGGAAGAAAGGRPKSSAGGVAAAAAAVPNGGKDSGGGGGGGGGLHHAEALQCVGVLAEALGPMWMPYVQQLLEVGGVSGPGGWWGAICRRRAARDGARGALLRCGDEGRR